MSQIKQCKLLSVNAKKLFFSANLDSAYKKSPTYVIDQSKATASNWGSVAEEIQCPDNALFYQVCKDAADYDSFLYRNLIYVDFSSLFRTLSAEKISSIISQIDTGKVTPYSFADQISKILDPEQGIKMIFPDGEEVQFVAFDKSSSMARSSRMSFINKRIYDDINDSLNLHIDFSKIPMQLSKYYAYRGLYLTSGKRIDECGAFQLNKENVIVLPDFEQDVAVGDPLFQANNCSDGEAHSFSIILEKRGEHVNYFDGEGLISPYFSGLINNALALDADATSFQIRMPFIKGVLHEVDFHAFLNEFTVSDDRIVLDCFGIPRDLSKAHIILTQSMFKCKKWLEYYWTTILNRSISVENDPMEFFFNEFHTNKHALYIGNTNLTLHAKDAETLNYQFLSTINFSAEEIEALVDKHFELGKEKIKRNIFAATSQQNTTGKIVTLAKQNPAFLNEPRLKENVDNDLKQLRLDCAVGKLLADGEHRFLSGDLMAFLINLIHSISASANKECFDYGIMDAATDRFSAKLYTLNRSNRCYIPQRKNVEQEWCGVLRSPHLSRNEEYALEIYKHDDKLSFYDKYFKQLTGIIMLSSHNLGPMTLGGADYDGDIVKIFYNDAIVSKIIKNTLHPRNNFLRTAPFISIPSGSSVEELISPKAMVKLILNTFSGQVGIISNIALRFALDQYATENEFTADNDYCSMASIVVGLEIDSVKKGRHPIEDINHLKSLARGYCSQNGKDFIEWRDTIEAARNANYSVKRDPEKDDTYILTVYRRDIDDIPISKPSEISHSLLLLPYFFAKRELEETDKDDVIEILNPPGNALCFSFEEDPQWKKKLDKEKRNQVKSLFEAFRHAKTDLKTYYSAIQRYELGPSYRKLTSLLRIKYDLIEETRFNNSDITVNECLSKTLACLGELLPDIASTETAIHNTETLAWCFSLDDQKANKLCSILKCEREDISDEVLKFLSDFSFNGYLTLPLALNSILEVYRAECAPEEYFGGEEVSKRADQYGYYQQFLNSIYESGTVNSPLNDTDTNEFENYENDEFDTNDTYTRLAKTSWNSALINKCTELLYGIFSASTDTDLPDDIESQIIKYSWYAKSAADKEGYYFWEVFPLDTLRKYLKTGV